MRAVLVASSVLICGNAHAQFGPPPPLPGPAREAAPIDLTGQWVSVVTEDWRFRMAPPQRADALPDGAPMTPAGIETFRSWDPRRDEAEGNECKAYGAPGIMRMPGRIRVSWRDADTLEIQADAGRQTRVLSFGTPPANREPTWQGVSRAEWILHRRGPQVQNGSLKVVTTGMRSGYLRKDGLPYTANATLTEYFDVLEHPDGSTWLVVKAIVHDAEYWMDEWIVSSNFRKEDGRGGWDPTPCSLLAPR